jgi:hypothetical protein
MLQRKNSVGRADDDARVPDAMSLLARWNVSLASFYVRRWQRQMELPVRLARSASPRDLMEAGRAFEQDLVADYRDQVEALQRSCDADEVRRGPHGPYEAELLKAQEHARQLLDQAKAQADRILASARARADEIVAKAAPKSPASRRSANG